MSGYLRNVGPDGIAKLDANGIGYMSTQAQLDAETGCCTCPCLSCTDADPNFSANLVTNGGFEANGFHNASANLTPTGWTAVTGVPTVLDAAFATGYPPAPEGRNILMGGFNTGFVDPPLNLVSVAEQDIDVSGYSDAIDASKGCFYFRATLGTYGDGTTPQDDEPMVELVVGGIAIVTFGPIPGNIFGFRAFSSASGRLAAGTRTVTVRYTGTRDPAAPLGYSSDAYVDDVRFHMCAAENA